MILGVGFMLSLECTGPTVETSKTARGFIILHVPVQHVVVIGSALRTAAVDPLLRRGRRHANKQHQ